MAIADSPSDLCRRRKKAGLTQRELARRAAVPQPNIAAYESGRRRPTPQTLARLDAVLSAPTAARLVDARTQILDAAARRGLSNVRVFGSIARGTSSVDSDVDLLVHPGPGSSVFDLAGFMAEVEALLGVSVDVVSDRGAGPTMDRIRAEAVTLADLEGDPSSPAPFGVGLTEAL